MIHVYHQNAGENWLATAVEDDTIRATAFASAKQEALKQVLENIPYHKPFQTEEKPSPLAQRVFDAIKSVLAGKGGAVDFKFENDHLSEYARKVLGCLTRVPVGYVTTYKALSDVAGGGPRAVGQIMASNPFSPLVPCHRVIKSDFSIGGYGGSLGVGVGVKRTLLKLEDRGFNNVDKVKTDCGPLDLYPVRFLKQK